MKDIKKSHNFVKINTVRDSDFCVSLLTLACETPQTDCFILKYLQ